MKKLLAVATFLVASVALGGISTAAAPLPHDGEPLLCTFDLHEHVGGTFTGSSSCTSLQTLTNFTGSVQTLFAGGGGGCPTPQAGYLYTLRSGGAEKAYIVDWFNRVAVPPATSSLGIVAGLVPFVLSGPAIGVGPQQCGPGGAYSSDLTVVMLINAQGCGGLSFC
jgi:hypothetical protein